MKGRFAALEESTQGQLLVRVTAFALLVAVTLATELTGIFLVPAGPIIGGVNTSWAWPYVIVANLFVVWLTPRLDESRFAMLVPPILWIVCYGVMARRGPSQHLIEPDGAASYGFLLTGWGIYIWAAIKAVVPRGGTRRRGASRTPGPRRAQ